MNQQQKTREFILFYITTCPVCRREKLKWDIDKQINNGKIFDGYQYVYTEFNMTNLYDDDEDQAPTRYPSVLLKQDGNIDDYDYFGLRKKLNPNIRTLFDKLLG